jgi:hypothetical protein
MAATRTLAPAPPESGLAPIAGDRGWPLIGYSWQALHDPLGVGRRRYEQYGPVSWMNAFGIQLVSLLGHSVRRHPATPTWAPWSVWTSR